MALFGWCWLGVWCVLFLTCPIPVRRRGPLTQRELENIQKQSSKAGNTRRAYNSQLNKFEVG